MKQLVPGLPSADAGAVPAFPADERQTGVRSIERWRSAQRTHLSPLTVTRYCICYTLVTNAQKPLPHKKTSPVQKPLLEISHLLLIGKTVSRPSNNFDPVEVETTVAVN